MKFTHAAVLSLLSWMIFACFPFSTAWSQAPDDCLDGSIQMTSSSPEAGTVLPIHVFDLCAPERVFFNTASALDGTMTNLQLFATIPPEFQYDGRAFLWRDGSFAGSVSNQVTVTGTNLVVDLEGEVMELGDELELRIWIVSPCGNFPIPEGTVVDFDFVWELAEDPGQCYSIEAATAQLSTETPAILPAWNPASPGVAPGDCFTWTAEVANEGFGDAYGVNGQFTIGPSLSFNAISAIRVSGVPSTNVNYTAVTNANGSVTVTYDTDEVIPGASEEADQSKRKIEFDLDVCVLNCDVSGMTGNIYAESGCFGILCDSATSESSITLVYDQPLLVEDVTFSTAGTQEWCSASYTDRYSFCDPLQITSVLSNASSVAATNVSYTWRLYAPNSNNHYLDNVNVSGSDATMNISVSTQTYANEGANEMNTGGYGNELYLVTITVDRIEPGESVTLTADQVLTCPFEFANDITSSNYLKSWWGHHWRRSDRLISWRDSCGALIRDDHLSDDVEQWRTLAEFPSVSGAKVQGTPILSQGQCGVIQPAFRVPWWAIMDTCDEGISVSFTLPGSLEWGGGDIVLSNDALVVTAATMVEGVDFTYDPITRTFDIPLNQALRNHRDTNGYCTRNDYFSLTIPICVGVPCIGGVYDIPVEWFGGSCCGCEYRISVETMPITVVCPGCTCGVSAGDIISERPVNGVMQPAEKGLPGDLLTYTDEFVIAGNPDTCCLTNVTWRHQYWSIIGDAQPNYDDPVLVYQGGSANITVTRANGAVENYAFEPTCLRNAPSHPDDGDGDGTGDASGYCDFDFGAEGIVLCAGDSVSVSFDATVNCYSPVPANENILDWAYSLTSGFDKDRPGTACGPNAHFYDLVKYELTTWQPYFSQNGNTGWVGIDGQDTETCERKQYMIARYVERDDEPTDPFPDEERYYLTNSVMTVNMAPGLLYDPDPDAYILAWTRGAGWQTYNGVVPAISTNPQGGQTLTWDLSMLTDTNGDPVTVNRDEYHEIRIYYAVRPTCDFQQGPCVDLNGDGDCGDLNTVIELYDSCGRLRSSRTSGGQNLNWDAVLNNARGDLTSTMSPVLQNSSTRELSCWTLQINNIGDGHAWNAWTYLDIADDIVIDTITDVVTGAPITTWVVTNDANDVYLELGDIAPLNGRRILRICGHLEDTNGDGDACDTGFDGQERGVTATTAWGCEFADAPPDLSANDICESVQSEVTIRLLPANLQIEKSINNGEPIALCEEFPNVIRMLNTGFTDGFNIRIIDLPPPGVFIDTNSIVFYITDANGIRSQVTACATAPDVLTTFGTGVNEREFIQWDICPAVVLPRGGVFEIEYNADTDCEFISGRPSRVIPSFEAPCGQRVFLGNDYISPVSVLAGQQNADFSDFDVSLTPINGDGCGEGSVSLEFVNMPGSFPDGNPATDLQIIQVLPPGIHYVPGTVVVGPIGGTNVTDDPLAYCVEYDDDGNAVFTHNGDLIELRSGIVAGQEVLIFELDDLAPGEGGTLDYQYRADVNCVADGRVHYSLIRYNSPMDCPDVPGGTCAEIQFENQRSVPLIERRAVVPVTETHTAEILCLGEQIEFTINAQNTGNGWADNFSMYHTFDPTIFTPVAISDGGIVTNYGVIEWVSGLTSLSDTDGDGLADELAPGAPIKADGSPLTVVFEFTGPLGCNTHRVTSNRSYAAWGCDNLPSLAGCPPPPGSEGGIVCGIPDAIVEPTELLCPDLALEKSTQGVDADLPEDAPAILVGDMVTWVYAISNSGNTAMHNISVVDSEEGAVTCEEGPIPVIQPGAVFYCTLKAPQICGDYDNVATVSGTPTSSDCLRTAEDLSHYFGVCPGIDLEKATQGDDADTAPGPYVEVGDPVTWTYELNNWGNVSLSVTSLVDDVIGVIAIPSPVTGDVDGDGLLDPLETWVIEVAGVATAGQYMNTADVAADPVEDDGTSYGFPAVTDDDPSHYFGALPGIDVEKFTNGDQADTPTGPVIEVGDLVHWTYVVSNTGNIPLAGVRTSVIDSNEGSANYVSGDTDNDFLLDINEVWTFEIFGLASNGQYSNNVDVIGQPVDENGNPVPDAEDVSDADPSHYFGAEPGISLEKTVYYGHDGGASCPGDELEVNIAGAPVTYCFVITNTGNTYLSPVTVNDPALGFSTTLNILLPPGGSVTTHVESTISGDLVNTAEATGNPTDENGDDYPDVDDPSDEDDAAVDEISPGIQVVKTDYAGHDGGAGCPGGELVFGVPGADVTYCFQIVNTGNTYLVDIVVTDNDITPPFSQTVPGPLAPGASVMMFTERTMTADLTNTASVTGDPSDEEGDPYDDVDDVSDDDDAEVTVVQPAITLDKTVYAGHDGGASCFGLEQVTGVPGADVTYCFIVFNNGDTHLNDITITDNNLLPVFNQTFFGLNLPPGGSVTTHVETTISGDLVNTADVSGNPSDENGDDLPDVDDVTDENDAEVIELVPSINLEKTVYYGHDGGASCEGDELEINLPNTPVTYCFVVVNTGDTWLSGVSITDPDLGFTTFVNFPLPPGGVHTAHVETVIDGDLVNTASTSGAPTDGNGDPLPGAEPVTDEDDAEVDEILPGIEIIKTGYNGHDTGSSCPGTDLTFGIAGDDVTYCFEVVNTGNTYLVDIIVTDNDITPPFSQTIPGPIAPGERLYLHVETTMTADLTNTAAVTADPADEDGNPFDDVEDVTDDDPAEVSVTAPAIELSKTVYNGHDGGASCASGVEAVTNLYAADVTYCFVVENTGDTFLDTITVSDFDVSPTFTHVFTGLNLPPGGSATTHVERVILGDLENTADVSGNPTDGAGNDLDGVDDVTDDDPADVDMVEPGIEIVKTVYIGHDSGASCPGSNYELNIPGQQVTYCFEVINTGDTWLNPVIVDDPALGVTSANLGNLAPGASVTVHVETVMSADLTNVADVVGNPANEDGSDIPDMDDVTDDDPAEVDVETPAIDLVKTVYSGWDGGGGCPGVDLLHGLAGEQITYCFVVSNSGTAFLTDVTVTDNMINPPFSQTIFGQLAPGQSVVLFTQTTLDSDLVNTAEVTGTMSDENGNPAEDPAGDPITVGDDDPAEVDLVTPGIELQKTVYEGHNGGASCEGQELLVDTNGTPVTYCFVVVNTGDTHLADISITDPALGYTHTFTGVNLAPGGTLTNHIETSLLADLLNIADVSGNPTDENGDDLEDIEDVGDDDPAEVEEVRVGIDLQKTVYSGWDNGIQCPTAGDLQHGVNGDEITYCFKVTNTGNTYIVNAVVTDNDITPNYSGTIAGPIPPGGSAYLHVQTTLMGDLVNTASVSGVASDGDGDPYDDIPALTDEDPAEVDEVAPGIALSKTVYNGHDAGASCGSAIAVEAVTNLPNADVTYCFVVQNTGDTWLDTVTVTDADISPTFTHVFAGLNLAPGASATTHVERVIDGDLVNTADVSGNPTDENGDDLEDVDEVTDDDDALVDEISPGIEVVKTVYLGHDGGASCPGGDYELNVAGQQVTYCFVVVNTGDTWLNPVIVNDPALGVTSPNLGNLAPGASVTAHVETVMSGDLVNIADVTGNPANPDGSDIPKMDDVTDDDPAEVDVETPAIDLQKSVYSGWDGGGSCPGVELLQGLNGEQITYCFIVSNSGSAFLTDVTVTDNMIVPPFSQTISGPLAPGQTVVLYTQTTLQSDLVNTAEVTGTMSDEDGDPVTDRGGNPVTVNDDDPAEVDLVGPGIELSKTVYDSHDGGASCQGQELLVDTNGAPVTYCFVVENTGDTHLDNITIGDPALGYTHTFTGVNLAPGGTLTNHIETSLLVDLLNIADVSGNPTDENGDDLPNVDDVSDDDPAEVEETRPGFKLEKTVYAGHNGGLGCPAGTDLVNGVNGDAITYCFQLINTGNTYLVNLTVSDTDITPNYMGTVPGPIAPGEVAWLHTEVLLDGDLVNTATATATPSDDGGDPYDDIPTLTDDDDAEVDEHAPGIELLKTVYNGHDGGASCASGVESVTNVNLAAVTYCFVVVNTGDTYLDNISVTDNDLSPTFSHTFSGLNLAPGGSATTHVETVIDGDLVNTADVSGNPTDSNGDDLDGVDEVSDDDPADVDEISPSIELSKTVYNGHDGGASCEGGELHINVDGTPVTYCFVVVNTGDTFLDSITVVDNDIVPAFNHTFSGLNLAPGGSATTHVETVIDGDLVNTAEVSGNPTTPSGEDIPDAPNASDDDPAEVEQVTPGINIEKTVYAGHNSGVDCANAAELAYASTGGAVTYCFLVTNTGDTHLNLATVTDNSISPAFIGQVPFVLAPNQSAWLYAERTATADFTNTASVTGTPSDPEGNTLPDVPEPEDDDTAEVDVVNPSIELAKSVYLGHDNGASCAGGEAVTNANGAAVTYCFVVSNTGDTWLDDITITDTGLDPIFSHTFTGLNLAPGGTVTTHVETAIDGDLVNTAEVSGNPTDETGEDLPEVDDPTDDDDAEVDEVAPAIELVKTVYQGHDGGASCPGTDLQVNVSGTAVTYCFEVINTGDTVLNPVTLNDPDIPNFASLVVPGTAAGPLAPGDSAWFHVETSITADLVNTASASGNPANPDGSDIPGMDDPAAEDDAEVQVIAPAIDIQKTVYAGHNGGVSCPTAVEHLDVLAGEAITYCFRVTNTGNTPLVNATVTDNLVIPAYSATLPYVLQPGQSAWLHADRIAMGTITNIATATGTPSTPVGEELPEVEEVTDEDIADIDVHSPGISLAKTVYNGHDGGASCSGVEAVTNTASAAVTYCFVVENTGDTHLGNITVTDTDLDPDFTHTFTVNLAPGGSLTTHVETVISGDLENTADVTGNPTDEDGNDLPNLDEVVDEDIAEVDEVSPGLELRKTVYLGHDGGASCPGEERLINVPGALVTYCFEVVNTGDTFLDPVLVADTDLDPDFFSLNLGPLAPGQSVTSHHQTVIAGDLVNTGVATGNPTTPNGSDIPETEDTEDEDIAEVDEQTPSVDLQKTVYLGWDSGGGCPGSELVTGNPGDQVTYCFQVTNDGDANLVNVTVTDADVVPPFSQVIPALAPGQTVTLHIQRTLSQDILNTAGVEGIMADDEGNPITDDDGNPITTEDEDTAEVDVKGPEIRISKTVYEGHNGGASCEGVDMLLVNVGTPVTWCFLIENTGDTHLSPVVITDTDLDPAVTITLPGILAPGQSYTGFVERAAVNVMNTAGVSGTPVDENGTPLDNVDPVSDEDDAELRSEDFDLALEKTLASAGPFAPGDSVTFTITVRNEGSIAAQNVLIEDRPGPGLTLADPAWTQSGPDATRLIAGPIAPGGTESYTITFTIDADASGSLENRAEIAEAEDTSGTPRDDIDSTPDGEPGDPESEDDEDGDSLQVERFDLALVKQLASPGPFAPGDTVTYNITVTNQGDVAAQDILLTDTIPAGLTLADANWSDLGATAVGVVAGPLAPGASVTVTISFTIDANSTGRMINIAEISGANGPDGEPRDDIDSTADGDGGNDGPVTDDATNNENGDEDDHDIAELNIDVFDLALVKTLSSSGPFSPGDSITFTITVHNQGDVTATDIELSDHIPTGLTLADPAWTNTASNATVATSTLAGPLFPGTIASKDITFTIGAGVNGTLENIAEISSASDADGMPRDDIDSTADGDPGNDGPSVDDALDSQNGDEDDHDGASFGVGNFDLALRKTLVGNGPWEAGDNATFRITVFNQGAVTAQRVLIRDSIPAGLTLNDTAWTDNADGTASHLMGGLILPGASEFVEITFQIDPGFSGSVGNIAEIESAEDSDGNPREDIDGSFDSDPDNDGPVTDDEIDGTGTAGSDEDNHDVASLFVGAFDLALVKVLQTTGPVAAGDDITFGITVLNQGNIPAQNIQVIDYLPTGLILNDAAWQSIGSVGAMRYITGPIAPGDQIQVTLTATIQDGVQGQLENTAEIAEAEDDQGELRDDIDSRPDTNPGNDGPAVDDAVDGEEGDEDDSDFAAVNVDVFDLALTKTLSSTGPFANGGTVTYTITVFNQGSLPATQVRIVDYLAAGLVLSDPDWNAGAGNLASTVVEGPIAPGDSTTVEITCLINTATPGEITNQAEITSALDGEGNERSDIDSTADDDPGNDGPVTDDDILGTNGDEDDHDIASITVEPFDLALTKSLTGTGPFFPGDAITYSITVYNQGTLPASQIEITDHLPAGLKLDDSNWTEGANNTATTTIAGPIPAGGETTLSIQCLIEADASGDVENIAEISAMHDADGNPQTDIDSIPDADPDNDGFMVDDEILNQGNDEDDHDPAMLTITPFGTIGTTVWIDLSNDGSPSNEQLSELGLEGITVTLYEVVNGVTNEIGTAVTGPNGEYEFVDVPPGDYLVVVDPSSVPEAFSLMTTPMEYQFTLEPGESTGEANFGFNAPPTAVEIEFFMATLSAEGVDLSWRVGFETGTLGYHVYRLDPDGPTRITESLVLANGDSYAVRDPHGIGGIYILKELTDDLGYEAVAEALTMKAAPPVEGETLILAAEDGAIELTTGAAHPNLLLTGFDSHPKVTDETNQDYPVELIGEPMAAGDDKGVYLSVEPERKVKAVGSE